MRKRKAKGHGLQRVGGLSGDAKLVQELASGTKVYVDGEDGDTVYIVRFEPIVYRLAPRRERP